MGTILTIVVIILLGAALPTFPYRMRYAEGQPAPATGAPATGNHATSLDHDPFLGTYVQTSRVRRTWSDRLKMWQRAYETKIWDSRDEITGRGSSPEASQKAAERRWIKEKIPQLRGDKNAVETTPAEESKGKPKVE